MTNKRARTGRAFDPNNLRTQDALILVPLIVGVSICFVISAFLVRGDVYIRWGGLGLNTAVLFGFLFYRSRELTKTRPFWIFAACFLVLHMAAWITLLMFVDEWRLAWFGFMAIEAPVFLNLSTRTQP